MRLITYEIEHKSELGVISRGGSQVYLLTSLDMDYKTMQELMENISESEKQLLEHVSGQDPYKVRGTVPIGKVSFLALIPHPWQDVICLGINYTAHAEGSARFKREASDGKRPYATHLSKRANHTTDPRVDIPSHRGIVTDLDYEAELTVTVGREASHVREEDVKGYMFEYTIISSISARTLQTRRKQWYFGKGLDGFLSTELCIATVDELPCPSKVQIQSRVNGELRQDSNTELFIFDVNHIISELSQGMTLKPGTIITTGAPAGVDIGLDPPKFLVLGDVVGCTIEGVGTIVNKVTNQKETNENGLFTCDNTQTKEHCPDCSQPEEAGTDAVARGT